MNKPSLKKIAKIAAYSVLAVVGLVVLLVLTLPLWLGTIARPAVNMVVPKITQTEFDIAHLYLNPYTGRFELGGFLLGNPGGYEERVAVSLEKLVFDMAMTTLCDKYVHVEEVTVENLFLSYVDGGQYDVDNFTQIQYNVAGGKEKYEAAKAAKEAKQAEADNKADDETEEVIDEASKKKFVIDRLSIKGVKLKYGRVTIPIPFDIVLTDLGKETDGMTLAEIGQEVWNAILKAAGSIGDGVKALGSLVGEGTSKAADSVTEGARKATHAVRDLLNFKK